jgi:hypothetical protein
LVERAVRSVEAAEAEEAAEAGVGATLVISAKRASVVASLTATAVVWGSEEAGIAAAVAGIHCPPAAEEEEGGGASTVAGQAV